MKTLLRENPVIALSIALPILVVALFSAATLIPKLLADPPAHSLLLIDNSNSSSVSSPVNVDVSVVDGRIKARISRRKVDDREYFPRIYIYDHATASVREIPLPLPADVERLKSGTAIVIPELADMKISTALRAPDGYEFRGNANGDAGLMTGLFGGNRARNSVNIAKDGAIVRVRVPVTQDWYSDIRFLGWVVE